MSETCADLVANSDILVNAMGYWPSFHDAYLTNVLQDGDTCRVSIHVFHMTDQVDQRGFFVLINHHLVTLEMSGVTRCTLPANYQRDTLFELTAQRYGRMVIVVFESVIEPNSWQVLCREVRVTDVSPCDPTLR